MLAGYKTETTVTLNYGGKIIGQQLIFFFSQFTHENCTHQFHFVDNIGKKTEGFDRNIKLLARFVQLRESAQVRFEYFKSRTRFRA